MKKRFCALCLAVTLLLSGAVPVHAAANLFSVSVRDNQVQFLSGGKLVGAYPAASTSLTLTTDGEGDLLVCFYTTASRYIGVTLGKQTSVTLRGAMSSLTLAPQLNKNVQVILGVGGAATTMAVQTPASVVLQGWLGTLSVSEAAQVSVADGAVVNTAKIANQAKFLVSSKATVGSRQTLTGSTSPAVSDKVNLRTRVIYASYGDRLRELRSDLASHVTAYIGSTKLHGSVAWDAADTTAVKRSASYRFYFTPDDSRYATVSGTIRIDLDNGDSSSTSSDRRDESVDLVIGEIDAKSGARLSSLLSDLEDEVKAYNDDDRRIEGRFKWIKSSSTRVDETEEYKFRFTPNSSRYEIVTDWITIHVD